MILETKRGSELPEGAVRLTRDEALAHQKAIIRDWPREGDVVFLRYGRHISTAAIATTCFSILNYFKNYLRIPNSKFLLLLTPAVFIPGFVSYSITERNLTNELLLMKMDCPMCHHVKFALSQLYLGVGFPLLFGYFSSATLAQIIQTYPVPRIDTHAREFWQLTLSVFKKGAVKFQIAGFIQAVVVLLLPYLQTKELVEVMKKLQEHEERERVAT